MDCERIYKTGPLGQFIPNILRGDQREMIDIRGVYHDVDPTWSTRKSRGLNTLVYVTDGKVDYQIDRTNFILEPGELLFIPSHIYRSWTNCKDILHKKYTAVFSWEQQVCETALTHMSHAYSAFRFTPRSTAYFEQRLAYMFVQWLGKRMHYEQITTHTLAELLILIVQERAERHCSPSKEHIVRKMQDYILYHFREVITLGELAAVGEVSPNYVTILFKEVTGTTPIQYVHQIRVNTALNLFENTQMTVREVAEYLGYCDQSYFNRVFKKWMGMAPTHIQR